MEGLALCPCYCTGSGVTRCLDDATVCDASAFAETDEVVLVLQGRQCYLAMTVHVGS